MRANFIDALGSSKRINARDQWSTNPAQLWWIYSETPPTSLFHKHLKNFTHNENSVENLCVMLDSCSWPSDLEQNFAQTMPRQHSSCGMYKILPWWRRSKISIEIKLQWKIVSEIWAPGWPQLTPALPQHVFLGTGVFARKCTQNHDISAPRDSSFKTSPYWQHSTTLGVK